MPVLSPLQSETRILKLFEELKRRNVFRVATAYVVVAWLVLQFADIVLNHTEQPDWVFGAILSALGVGLFLAIILSWVFEITPEGIKYEHEVDRSASVTAQTGKKLDRITIAVLAIAVAYFAIDKFFLRSVVEPDIFALTELSNKSIAVLPLANRSAREEDLFFTDGMHDDLLTQLAKISSLKVISRTSVMRYRDTDMSIPDIADELNVNTVLEGGVQRAGDQVRINMQLIEAQTDEHLWAETYDRLMTAENLFAIQSEITQEIVESLKTTLTDDEVSRLQAQPTGNLEAFEEYMRGQQALVARTVPGIEKGRRHFERALELDPNYLDAVLGLANSLHLLNEYGGWPEATSLDPAMVLVNDVLDRDPGNGDAYMVRGELYRHYREYDLATADFERAIALSPGNPTVYQWYSLLKTDQGNPRDAHVLLRRAHELNPMSGVIHANYAAQPFFFGRDEDTLAELDRVKEIHPEYPLVWSLESRVYRARGDALGALNASLRIAEFDPSSNRVMGACLEMLDLGAGGAAIDCIDPSLGGSDFARAVVQTIVHAIDGDKAATATQFDAIFNTEDRVSDRIQLGGDTEYRIGFLGYSAIAAGRYDEAHALYEEHYSELISGDKTTEISAEQVGNALDVAYILARSGDRERAEALLRAALKTMESLYRNRGLNAYGFMDVQAHALLGNTEEALEGLEECAELGYLTDWQGLKYLPHYDSIRDDSRFRVAIAALQAASDKARARAESEGLLQNIRQ